jgi:hypothetical protein
VMILMMLILGSATAAVGGVAVASVAEASQ